MRQKHSCTPAGDDRGGSRPVGLLERVVVWKKRAAGRVNYFRRATMGIDGVSGNGRRSRRRRLASGWRRRGAGPARLADDAGTSGVAHFAQQESKLGDAKGRRDLAWDRRAAFAAEVAMAAGRCVRAAGSPRASSSSKRRERASSALAASDPLPPARAIGTSTTRLSEQLTHGSCGRRPRHSAAARRRACGARRSSMPATPRPWIASATTCGRRRTRHTTPAQLGMASPGALAGGPPPPCAASSAPGPRRRRSDAERCDGALMLRDRRSGGGRRRCRAGGRSLGAPRRPTGRRARAT